MLSSSDGVSHSVQLIGFHVLLPVFAESSLLYYPIPFSNADSLLHPSLPLSTFFFLISLCFSSLGTKSHPTPRINVSRQAMNFTALSLGLYESGEAVKSITLWDMTPTAPHISQIDICDKPWSPSRSPRSPISIATCCTTSISVKGTRDRCRHRPSLAAGVDFLHTLPTRKNWCSLYV